MLFAVAPLQVLSISCQPCNNLRLYLKLIGNETEKEEWLDNLNMKLFSLKCCQKLVNRDLNMWHEPHSGNIIFSSLSIQLI